MTDSQPARGSLLPCPFCGSVDIARMDVRNGGNGLMALDDDDPDYTTGCRNCGASVETRVSRVAADAAWNTRVAGGGESIDALKIRELCHNIIRACKMTDGVPLLAIADEAARRILEELRRAAMEGNEAVSVEMDKLVREHWTSKPSRIVEPVGRGGVVTDEIKSLRLAMEEYGSDAWVTISDGDRCRAPGNHAEAIRQLLEPVAGGGGVSDEMVERACDAWLSELERDRRLDLTTGREVPPKMRQAMRAALVAALQVKP